MKPKTETCPENHEKVVLESIKAETEANRAKTPTANRLRRRPVVVYVLLVFQVSLFFLAALSPSTYEYLKKSVSLIPSQIMSGQNLHSLITYIFFSPSVSDPSSVFEGLIVVAYILMYFSLLLAFGRGSESIFGRLTFLLFFLFCGIIGGLFHSAITVAMLSPLADVPMLGAIGALFGVMASYAVFYPRRGLLMYSLYREPWSLRWRRQVYIFKISVLLAALVLLVVDLLGVGLFFPHGIFFPIGNTANIGGFLGGVTFSLLFRISGRGPWKRGLEPEMEYELAEPQQ